MKALVVVVPILLIGGTLGAAFMGVINIPGVTPKKAEAKKQEKPAEETSDELEVSGDQTDQTDKTDPGATPIEEEPEPTEPPLDPVQGAKVLAKYWDAVETKKLIEITEGYNERDLAQILIFMQKQKVAEILGAVEAERATKISRELQRLASVVAEQPAP